MAAPRALPRKPDWLEATPPSRRGMQDSEAQRRGADTTARVLEFATAARPFPPTAASSGRQAGAAAAAGAGSSSSARLLGQPAGEMRAAWVAAAGPLQHRAGSVLGPEPAYRSALSRLSLRPAAQGGQTAAAPAAALGDGLLAPPAQLPSSRLDALLASRPSTATSTRQQPPPTQQQPHRPTLDELLQRRPASSSAPRPASATAGAAAVAQQQQPLPSSRLDQLLSLKPALAAGASSSGASGSGRHMGGSAPVLRAAAAPKAAAPATALSTVVESPASSHLAGSPAAAQQPLPAVPAGAAPTAAGAWRAPSPPAVVAPAPALSADPALQDRLRDRIELAKAQIRQQLSPMFRLSEVLVGAEQDPERAADALDAATGISFNGFERLARRPGSRGGGGTGNGSIVGGGGAAYGSGSGSAAAVVLPGRGALSLLGQPGAGVGGTEEGQQGHGQLQQLGSPQRRACAEDATAALRTHPGSAAAGDRLGDDVDSLVANARAAAARAQSALVDLASPPRHHSTLGTQPRSGRDGGATCSVPRTTAPLPHAQLTVSVAGSRAVGQHQAEDGGPMEQQLLAVRQLATAGSNVDLWVGGLRQQAEAMIRSECEKLVASMHLMFDGFLDTMQQQQQQQWGQQQQQTDEDQEAAAAQHHMAGSSSGARAASLPDVAAADDGGDAQPYEGALATSNTSGSPRLAGSVLWGTQEVQHQFGASARQGQEEPGPAGGGAGSSGTGDAEFRFASEEEQQLEPQGQAGGNPAATAGPAASSTPAEDAADQQSPKEQQFVQHWSGLPGEGGLAGFGSPIRMNPSPAKPALSAVLAGNGMATGRQQQQQQQQQAFSGTAARTLSLGGQLSSPTAEQTTPVSAAPTGSRPGEGMARDGSGPSAPPSVLDGFLTARSTASAPYSSSSAYSGDVFDSPRSHAGSEGGASSRGSRLQGVAAAGGVGADSLRLGVGQQQPSAALLGSGKQRDLDSLVGSIRRMAAQMRLNHGALPSQSAGSRLLPGGPRPGSAAQHPQQGSSSPSRLFLTPAGSTGSSGAAGGGRSGFHLGTPAGAMYTAASSSRPGSAGTPSSVSFLHRKPPR